MIKVKVDYTEVKKMAAELARYSPIGLKNIMLLETASIIKICALRAKVASKASIKRHVENYAKNDFEAPQGTIVHINTVRDIGRVWLASRRNEGREAVRWTGATSGAGRAGIRGVGALMVYDAASANAWHLTNERWQAYLLATGQREAAMKTLAEELYRRRGLMLLSWLQIGDALGVSLSSVSPAGALNEAVARSARGPGGRSFTNGIGSTRIGRSGLIITVENRSPLAVKRQGQATLDRAVAQRVKGFRIALAKGVLNDLQLRAARWKGIFVRPG